VHPQRFRHHFSHTWLARGRRRRGPDAAERLVVPRQMLTWYGASAAGARARSSYDLVMNNNTR
jgi:integrase/recombinase XerD